MDLAQHYADTIAMTKERAIVRRQQRPLTSTQDALLEAC
jgi:hypothetical protein